MRPFSGGPALLSAALLLAVLPARAQNAAAPAIGVGTPIGPADLSRYFAIPPDGTGLPPGSGTAAQGAAIYAQHCIACHGDKLQGVKAIGGPALVGGRGTLAGSPEKTVESYWPYATTLFDYVKRAMPMDAPGSLTDDQVYALVAFVLAAGRIVPQDAAVDARTLPMIRMPNRDGFVPDHRPEPQLYAP
jgi:cytochrome c